MSTTMTRPTAGELRAYLTEWSQQADLHGGGRCDCCTPFDGLRDEMMSEVLYFLDQYRPNEGTWAHLTEAEIDQLADVALEAAVAAARAAIVDTLVVGLLEDKPQLSPA